MSLFAQLKADDDLKEVIKFAFDAKLDISGAWGYSKVLATVIHSSDVPIPQLEHMLASMRAHIEMNMTLQKEDRYAGIDINEIAKSEERKDTMVYHKITYQITAIKEDAYTSFIKEYKEGYGTEGFDMTEHFSKRREATITRNEIYWFKIA